MRLDLARLPNDPVLLQRVVRDLAEVLERQDAELTATKARLADRDAELEKLQLFLAALKRLKFGRSSEKHHPDQLTLSLEAIEEQIAALAAKSEPPSPAAAAEKKPSRRPLPGHLPREERRHEPAAAPVRPAAASCMSIGEDVTRSSRLRAGAVQGDPPRPPALRLPGLREHPPGADAVAADRARPAGAGAAGPGAGRQVLRSSAAVSAIPDLRPRRRRPRPLDARRLGRPGDLAVAASGRAAGRPRLRRGQDPCRRHAGAGARSRPRPHQDRAAVGLRPRRPAVGRCEPAGGGVLLFAGPQGRTAGRASGRLPGFLQADAYAGFDKLYGERIVEVACWAHARRKIFDVHESTKSPIAAEALAKIAELYRIEATIRGRPRRSAARCPTAPGPAAARGAEGLVRGAAGEAAAEGRPGAGHPLRARQLDSADPLPRRRPAGDRQQPCRKHPARCRPRPQELAVRRLRRGRVILLILSCH